ncbi:hypothetical protein OJAV_G00214380 [Oryzias javanicus]|uniref:Uncharacterized protein n=1 Tax=Oryzias javanicus TaxID=123683 RepID=A0A3S2PPB5_ORYJA|nr:hypothetical protein OJAV_G00214380 [Oryzias javanicus]
MASYHLLQRSYSNFESPAKVFAQLKSKVQKEAKSTKMGKNGACRVREEFRPVFHSPKKTNFWMTGESTDTRGFDSDLNEANALTLSPITSPQKTFDCPRSDDKLLDETPTLEFARPLKDHLFLESTAVSHPMSSVSRCLAVERGRPIRGSDRSPVKAAGRDAPENRRAPLVIGCSPNALFSPMRNRKRKLEQHEFGKTIGVKEETKKDKHLQMDGKSSASGKDVNHRMTAGGVRGGGGGGGCVNQPEILNDHMFTPRNKDQKLDCSVAVERLPFMSPAKMFAFLKERENKIQKLDAHINSSRRDLFGNLHQTEDIPLPAAENHVDDAPGRCTPAQESVGNTSDSQSDSSRSACPPRTSMSPAPVLLEDPLVLNSPQITIPKKCETKLGLRHWPNQRKFPVENVIYLKKWLLMRSSNGLFVDGIHREDNIPWHSNIIVERVSKSMLKTVSGRVYILVGGMLTNVASDFPKWLLQKFANGFPADWKELYEKFLSESKEKKKKKNDKKCIQAAKRPEAASVSCSARKQRLRALKTPDVSPPSSSVSTKVSRSGRVIKPPLEYWKGGRVILDAQMNVTIHECYNSILSDSMAESQTPSEEPVRGSLPRSKGKKCSSFPAVEEVSVPVRKIKRPQKQGKNGPKPGNFPDSSDASPGACSSTDKRRTRQTGNTDKPVTRLSKEEFAKPRMTNRSRRRNKKAEEQQKSIKIPPTVNPLPTSKKHCTQKPIQEEHEWTEEELSKLQEVLSRYPKHVAGYWEKVARMVGTRTAEECHKKHTSQGASHSPTKTNRKQKKGKADAAKPPAVKQPVISAKAGTLKRKQQVRQFLETLPKDDMNDAFSSTYMQNKRFEIPSLCSSDDHDSMLGDLEFQTPKSACFPEVKTPQCLHITPGMMGSPNTNNDDKYVYQLQKRMKKNQFNVRKNPVPSKKFLPTPGVKQVMRRCGETENTSFVVWEMFPGKDEESAESGEEEDYYFSDD